MNSTWWKQPLQVIQPNLQVADTNRIEPDRLAWQMKEMGANTIVFNVGGIYAWYPTELPYHTVNPYLPRDRDLLADVIQACRDEHIRFVARFDFSKAEDTVWLQQPRWFRKNRDGEPVYVGAYRPGPWPLLVSACINGGYRNEAVAHAVLKEAANRYDFDGVFFNATHYEPCYCETCRRKYKTLYGRELPEDDADVADDWNTVCVRDQMIGYQQAIREIRTDLPLIHYYHHHVNSIRDRAEIGDLLCAEAQNILSLGKNRLSESNRPALVAKLGAAAGQTTAPLGIVHTSPGMDWRHTGIPPAEHRFWLSQICANGAHIWHSLTGIPDTIGDKRILKTVADFNQRARKIAPYMHGARSLAPVLLLYRDGEAARTWAEALTLQQLLYDLAYEDQIADGEKLREYAVVIVPDGWRWTTEWVHVLRTYVEEGGSVLCEGASMHRETDVESGPLCDLLGITPDYDFSPYLSAAYIRFEQAGLELQHQMEQTELIAFRGHMLIGTPAAGAEAALTLVPPFSPPEAAGAPPERASLPAARTDIPLAVDHAFGQGRVLYVSFALSSLFREYRLHEHELLMRNAVRTLLGTETVLETDPISGLQVSLFERGQQLIVHFINGTGRRPLANNLPLPEVNVRLRLSAGRLAASITSVFGGESVPFRQEADKVCFRIPSLQVWDVYVIEWKTERAINKAVDDR